MHMHNCFYKLKCSDVRLFRKFLCNTVRNSVSDRVRVNGRVRIRVRDSFRSGVRISDVSIKCPHAANVFYDIHSM